jgi:hypothetical protein
VVYSTKTTRLRATLAVKRRADIVMRSRCLQPSSFVSRRRPTGRTLHTVDPVSLVWRFQMDNLCSSRLPVVIAVLDWGGTIGISLRCANLSMMCCSKRSVSVGIAGWRHEGCCRPRYSESAMINLLINTTTTARVYYYLKRSHVCVDGDRLEMGSFYLATLFKNCVIVQSV